MKFERVHEFPAPASDVLAMLLDPAFREAVCASQDALDHSVSVSSSEPPSTVEVRQKQNTSDTPGVARKVIGDSVETVQREEWTSADAATFEVTIPGKPGHLRGRITLTDNGDGTSTERFDAEVKVNIPLVGGKLEGLIGKVLGSGLRRERETGLRWLAGDR
jgi:hypothetical protein